jgi:hypothetical protein
MQALMRKAGAVVRFDGMMMEGWIDPLWPTYMTMAEEMGGDGYATLRGLLGQGSGLRPSAPAPAYNRERAHRHEAA